MFAINIKKPQKKKSSLSNPTYLKVIGDGSLPFEPKDNRTRQIVQLKLVTIGRKNIR